MKILREVTESACESAAASAQCTNCIYLKIKYSDFNISTTSRRVPDLSLKNVTHIFQVVRQMFENAKAMPVRLLGVRFGISSVVKDARKQTRLSFETGLRSNMKLADLTYTKNTPGPSSRRVSDTSILHHIQSEERKKITPKKSPAQTPQIKKKTPSITKNKAVNKNKNDLKRNSTVIGELSKYVIKMPKLEEITIIDSDIEA